MNNCVYVLWFIHINASQYIFIMYIHVHMLPAELVRLKLIQDSMTGQMTSIDTNGPVSRSATLLACHYDLVSGASRNGFIRGRFLLLRRGQGCCACSRASVSGLSVSDILPRAR